MAPVTRSQKASKNKPHLDQQITVRVNPIPHNAFRVNPVIDKSNKCALTHFIVKTKHQNASALLHEENRQLRERVSELETSASNRPLVDHEAYQMDNRHLQNVNNRLRLENAHLQLVQHEQKAEIKQLKKKVQDQEKKIGGARVLLTD